MTYNYWDSQWDKYGYTLIFTTTHEVFIAGLLHQEIQPLNLWKSTFGTWKWMDFPKVLASISSGYPVSGSMIAFVGPRNQQKQSNPRTSKFQTLKSGSSSHWFSSQKTWWRNLCEKSGVTNQRFANHCRLVFRPIWKILVKMGIFPK